MCGSCRERDDEVAVPLKKSVASSIKMMRSPELVSKWRTMINRQRVDKPTQNRSRLPVDAVTHIHVMRTVLRTSLDQGETLGFITVYSRFELRLAFRVRSICFARTCCTSEIAGKAVSEFFRNVS